MQEFDTARILYLSLLLGAIGIYYIAAHRDRMGQLLRHAVLWVMIFIGAIAAVGLWQDISPRLSKAQIEGDGVITVNRDRSGHYSIVAEINGAPIEFLVDTGASNIVLSDEDAKRAGIDLEELVFSGRAQTANGMVRTAPVRLETVALSGITDTRLKAYVTDGDMGGSLLGMDYLQLFQSVEIKQGQLILTR